MKTMTIESAIKALKENYLRALELNYEHPNYIRNPVAWALYRTWRMVEQRRP